MQTATQSPKAGERTQHTPGPWTVKLFTSGIRVNDDKSLDKSKAYTSGFAIEAQGRQEFLASTGGAQKCNKLLVIEPDKAAWCDPDGVFYKPEECEANARLIAAAPEYKEFFEELLDAHYGASYHHIGDGDGITKEVADRMRAFIAKQKE